MAADGIFLQSGNDLTVLMQRDYDSEAVLQTALAEHPEVIAGPTTTGDREARLLLVRREMSVPDSTDGSGPFSLDHLFLDAGGVPVLVEVKRSSDTRIRREVVGQMLDYAANAVKYWPPELLRQATEQTAGLSGRTVEESLQELRPDLDPEEFWKSVEANLRSGRIRMLFVADRLPDELVRVIEFLNEQMTPAEVLGVELRQYVGGEHVVYVPRVVGRTSGAMAVKTGSGQQWNRDTFLEAAASRCSDAEMTLIRRLLDDPESKGGRLSWGRGVTPGVGGWYPIGGTVQSAWVLNANNESATTHAYLMFYFADIARKNGEELVERAAAHLEQIPALRPKVQDARAAGWAKWPSVYLPDVVSSKAFEEAVFVAIQALTSPAGPAGGAA